jgi:DNA-binding transcriptional ArsR family regulator
MSLEKLVEIRQMVQERSASASHKPDRDARRLLLYVFTAMRGGFTRLQIIKLLSEKPQNTNQLAEQMNLDYKAIQHHLATLEKNNLVTRVGERYGVLFHLSNYLEANILALDEVVTRLERQMSRKIVYL